MNSNKSGFGTVLLVSAAILWAINGVWVKWLFIYSSMSSVGMVFYRCFFGGIILLVIGMMTRQNMFSPWKNKSFAVDITLLAFLGKFTSLICFTICLKLSGPATAAVLYYTFPVLVLVFTLISGQKKPVLMDVLRLIAAMVGIFLLSTHGRIDTLVITPLALIIGLCAATGQAFYTTYSAKRVKQYGAIVIDSWDMILPGIVLIPFSLDNITHVVYDARTIILTLLIVILGTVVPFMIYLKGVALEGGIKGSAIQTLNPAMAMVLSVIFFDLNVMWLDIVGLILVIGATVVPILLDSFKNRKINN